MKTVFILSLMPNWIGISRLPKALKEEKFSVITLSPHNSYLSKTRFADESYTFKNQLEFRRLFIKIAREKKIDFIIPAGDFSVSYLGQIMKRKFPFRKSLRRLQKVIQFSYSYDGASLLRNKSKLQEIASSIGVKTPDNVIVDSLEDLSEKSNGRQYPLVLKKDFGVSGTGVRICKDFDELKSNYQELSAFKPNQPIVQRIKNLVKKAMLLPIFGTDYNISLQNYVKGTACMHVVFCSKGKVLSHVTVLKEKTYPKETSPSAVVKVIDHKDTISSVEQLIKVTDYTGFASFDFLIDAKNDAYLLECNARPTPVVHISHLMGGNLVAMINTHLGIEHDKLPYIPKVHEIIALYPNEQRRDPESHYIKNYFHDIPHDEPEILQHSMKEDSL
ncbi:MAG: ATP-grasp domain-containing protein [Bacteroidetes bacterium]|jgi:biotin carboxylase|nr:ATP-grasp domain-containing protein [Bacteroidota bacterium]